MEQKELITVGIVAAGGIGVLLFVASQNTTTTSVSVDPNAAATENNIIAANTTAANTQASQNVALATLAYGYETTFDNNQTAVIRNGQDTSASIAINSNNNAAATTQTGIAANATYQAALLDTVSKIESTLAGAQTAQYTSYVTGQTALAGDAASTTNVAATTAAQVAVAGIQGTTATNVASIAGTTQQNVAQTNANAQVAVSNNQTTANVNAADRAASASKSNGFWGAISGIVGDVAKIFVPSAAASSSTTGGGPTITGNGAGNPTWGGAGSGAIAAAGG